jgi:nucleoside-diphosphate-sugar epimerase
MLRVLIVGCGDIARRIAPLLTTRYRVYGLIRNPERKQELESWGVRPVIGDLDVSASLRKLSGLAHFVIHLAPPQPAGMTDQRTLHLISALGSLQSGPPSRSHRRCRMLPQRLLYISTTGVYGNCHGEAVSETRPLQPETGRARRRVAAETALRDWGVRNGVAVSILRVPGIYADDRLPLDRLRKGTPALLPDEDSYTNHIHADDLARIIATAMLRARPGRSYNCVDDSALKMGDYFDLVADRFGLPRAPRISREQAESQLPYTLMSFLRESRRIGNRRLKRELKIRLRFPTVQSALEKMCLSQNEFRARGIRTIQR